MCQNLHCHGDAHEGLIVTLVDAYTVNYAQWNSLTHAHP